MNMEALTSSYFSSASMFHAWMYRISVTRTAQSFPRARDILRRNWMGDCGCKSVGGNVGEVHLLVSLTSRTFTK
jgi:hypothetical protein